MNVAHRAVEEEVAPDAAAEVRQIAFDRVVEGLRRHEVVGCQHERNSQWVCRYNGSLECEVCDRHQREYIFVCTSCRMRSCYRCRRHRLR